MLGRFVEAVGSLALGGMEYDRAQNSLGLKMFGLSSIRVRSAKCSCKSARRPVRTKLRR